MKGRAMTALRCVLGGGGSSSACFRHAGAQGGTTLVHHATECGWRLFQGSHRSAARDCPTRDAISRVFYRSSFRETPTLWQDGNGEGEEVHPGSRRSTENPSPRISCNLASGAWS